MIYYHNSNDSCLALSIPLNDIAVNNGRNIAERLLAMRDSDIGPAIDSGQFVDDPIFAKGKSASLGSFYAPFDWINPLADVVIIGITPGKKQALAGLRAMRNKLLQWDKSDTGMASALSEAKAVASFDGPMRDIAAKLMNHFNIHKLLEMEDSSDLFESAAARAHYTSVYRYPVLKMENGTWKNYSGGKSASSRANPLLAEFVEESLIPELKCFPDAWLIPFGPTPATVLNDLADRGIVKSQRILNGLNHTSGEQWNRHN